VAPKLANTETGDIYLPLGTTAHKQGRIAGENAIGGNRTFAGSLGTQVVRVFDLVAARTGLRHHVAASAGFAPATADSTADDHKAYYPDAHRVRVGSPPAAKTSACSASECA
jgi:NADPH-dependent 2,4-dienoyl-CoA reductase/sulfur reductase-like enzyme